LLAEHGVEFERRDYFKEPFTVDELRALFTEIGMSPSDLISTRSKAYKELGLADRDVSDEDLLELIPENPTLIRRPVIVKNGNAVIGFNKDKIEALIEE
jgi:Spx/MgsR family transcriptional regulator